MQRTGRTDAYAKLTAGCASCDAFISSVEAIYRKGGSIDFDGSKLISIDKQGQTTNSTTFDVVVRVGSTRVIRRTGGSINELPGGEQRARVTIFKDTGGWLISSFSRL